MLKTRLYMCPNLSACVGTCAAGHSWDDRQAHLQELGGEAPHGEGNGPRKGLMLKGEGPGSSFNNESSWKILGRSCDLQFIFFLNMQHERHFTPSSLWNLEQFLKEWGDLRARYPCDPTDWTAFWRPQNIKRNILCKAANMSTQAFIIPLSVEAFMWNNLSDTIWHTWSNPHKFH